MRAGEKGVVQSVVLFLGVSVLSGALAAGLAIPFAGLAGFGTEQASKSFEKLPQELTVPPLPVRSTIVDKDGKLIASLFEENRVQVGIKAINPIMRKAMIAIEDARFYQHGALDAKGTLRALLRNRSEGSVTQGGSSITQQFVKLTLQKQARTEAEAKAATEETYQRKIRELRFAVAIEKQYSKDEILEKYLNIAYFADGAHGVEAAARHYFGSTASKLKLHEAALLAGIVKNPSAYDPVENPRAAKDRRDLVIRRMLELKLITPQQSAQAIKTPVLDKSKVRNVPNGCAKSRYPFFCEYVVAKLLENPNLGRTVAERRNFIKTAGITVRTSIDPKVQAAADRSVREHSEANDEAIAAVTIVQPGTGLVLAMAQSRYYGAKKVGFSRTVWNYNVEQSESYSHGYGGFQNGSTMKVFTLAAAIQKGYPLSYVINSPETINLRGKKFRTCGAPVSDPNYTPSNSTKGGPNTDLVTATKNSVNTYFLQLSQRLGLCPINKLAARLGVVNGKNEYRQVNGRPELALKRGEMLEEIPSYTLGVGSVTPLMLANATATFAARGKHCKPVVIISIRDKAKKAIDTPTGSCIQVMKEEHADGINRALTETIRSGTGRALGIGRPAAGKTGTTSSNRSVWFVGYTPTMAAASVVSIADPQFMKPGKGLPGRTLDGSRLSFGDVSGGRLAGPVWQDAMRYAHDGLPEEKFNKPSVKIEQGEMARLPALGGMDPESAASILKEAGFFPEIAGERVPSEFPDGTVAYTDPRRRDGAPPGSTVIIYVSNGVKPKPKVTPTPGKPTVTISFPTRKPPQCPPWNPQCRRPPRR